MIIEKNGKSTLENSRCLFRPDYVVWAILSGAPRSLTSQSWGWMQDCRGKHQMFRGIKIGPKMDIIGRFWESCFGVVVEHGGPQGGGERVLERTNTWFYQTLVWQLRTPLALKSCF